MDEDQSEQVVRDKNHPWFGILTYSGLLISIPVFMVLHKMFPDPGWRFHFDRVLLFLATVLAVVTLFHVFGKLVFALFISVLLYLGYGSFTGNYGFESLYHDYRHLLFSLGNAPFPEEILVSALKPFPDKSEIVAAIEYDNPEVRTFALLATRKHFQEFRVSSSERVWLQYFAIFKEINSNWNYVNDPASREYYAKASESIIHLSGDCDDHSILMAACIKAAGGTARLIHTTNHIYPELLVGSKHNMETVNYLVKNKYFKTESDSMPLNFHVDETGQAWINLDYTAKYPGGPFMKDKILSALILQ